MELDYSHDPDGRLGRMMGIELDAELKKQQRRRDEALRKRDYDAASDAFERILSCIVEQIRRGLSTTRHLSGSLN